MQQVRLIVQYPYKEPDQFKKLETDVNDWLKREGQKYDIVSIDYGATHIGLSGSDSRVQGHVFITYRDRSAP